MKSCILLTECVDLNTSDLGMGCPNCISGERECDEPESSLRCWVPGRCNGNIIGVEVTFDLFQCLPACENLPACNYFTFDAAGQICELFPSCEDDMLECPTCVSGERECQIPESLKVNRLEFRFIESLHNTAN